MKKLLIFILFVLTVSAAFGQDEDSGKISGYIFGDYYYFIENNNPKLKDMNGFQLRRVYLTYDHSYDKEFSMRLRLEMNTPDGFSNNAGTSIPFIKDAYLKYKTGKTQFILGISTTPTWEVVEKIWGYRSVEKTPLDLQKFGSSRDFGLAVKGVLGENGIIKYHAMLANGNSNKSEFNSGKKVLLSVGVYPIKNIIFEVYGDYNRLGVDKDIYTLQGFAAYKTDDFRLGLHFAQQTRQTGADDLKLEIGSIFSAVKVFSNINLFARLDRTFDPNTSGEKISYLPFNKTAKSTFVVVGLDYSPIKNVFLMPNIEFIKYDENETGVTPKSDVVPRFTFYYTF